MSAPLLKRTTKTQTVMATANHAKAELKITVVQQVKTNAKTSQAATGVTATATNLAEAEERSKFYIGEGVWNNLIF